MDKIPTWDETFMNVAEVMSRRSKDPHTQVGVCLVKDHYILSTGYNGTPNGFDDSSFPWNTVEKYHYVIHAERNAILNYRGLHSDLEDAILYTTHFPCNECAKEIIQSGIRHVKYRKAWSSSDGLTPSATNTLFGVCGVLCEQV